MADCQIPPDEEVKKRENGGGVYTRRWRRRAFPILNPWITYTVFLPLSVFMLL